MKNATTIDVTLFFKAAGILAAMLCLVPVHAQTAAKPATLISLAAEASANAPNDLFRATVFAEGTHSNSATLARQINQQIAAAITVAKSYPSIQVRTGNTATYPIYSKNDHSIDSWRMRSEIVLESRDNNALAELLGKLQSSLSVSRIEASPAPETAEKAEADATIAAVQAFRGRAALIAGAMGKQFNTLEMAITSNRHSPVYPMMLRESRAVSSGIAPEPMPVDGGSSQTTVNIQGKIELTN